MGGRRRAAEADSLSCNSRIAKAIKDNDQAGADRLQLFDRTSQRDGAGMLLLHETPLLSRRAETPVATIRAEKLISSRRAETPALNRRAETPPGIKKGRSSERMADISPKPGSLSVVIRLYKGAVTRWARVNGFRDFAWQSRFHEHIIRNVRELDRIRRYILDNPTRWSLDRFHVST